MQFPTNITVFSVFTLLKSKKAQQKASKVIILILVVYISYVAAQITWFTLPNTSSSAVVIQNMNATSSKQVQQNVNITALQKLNLFGTYNKEEKNVVEVIEAKNAPETRLNLTLSGLVASDNQDNAAAIIEHQGKQETYGIDDLIKGTQASLAQVLIDRVLIKYSGRLETLMLDGFDYNQPARTLSKPITLKENKLVDHRGNAEIAALSKEFKNNVAQDPSKISDYLKIQPKSKNGAIIGYSLRAGKKHEFFQQAGLKSGDVAIQMNGYNLNVPNEAMQAITEMREATDMSILIDRRGELIEIRFSLN